MQNIIDLPSPALKLDELQLFHDKAFRTIRNLRHLGPASGPDTLLVQILLGKLPQTMKVKIIEHHDSATLDTNTIHKVVREHHSTLEGAGSLGLNIQPLQQRNKTTTWSNPPGHFQQKNHSRTPGSFISKPSSHDFHSYAADFATSNVADRNSKTKKKNECLQSLKGDHIRLSCPKVGSSKQTASRQPCNLQDHPSNGDGGRRNPNKCRQQEGGSRNSTRRARCDLPADRYVLRVRKQPTTSTYAVRNGKLKHHRIRPVPHTGCVTILDEP